MDTGAWQAAVHRFANSQTQLSMHQPQPLSASFLNITEVARKKDWNRVGILGKFPSLTYKMMSWEPKKLNTEHLLRVRDVDHGIQSSLRIWETKLEIQSYKGSQELRFQPIQKSEVPRKQMEFLLVSRWCRDKIWLQVLPREWGYCWIPWAFSQDTVPLAERSNWK